MFYVVEAETGTVVGVVDTTLGSISVTTTDKQFEKVLRDLEEKGVPRFVTLPLEDGKISIERRLIPYSSATVDDLAVALSPRYFIADEEDVEIKRSLADAARDGRYKESAEVCLRGYVLREDKAGLRVVGYWVAGPRGIRVSTEDKTLRAELNKLRHSGVKEIVTSRKGRKFKSKPYKEATFSDLNANLEGYTFVPPWGVEV